MVSGQIHIYQQSILLNEDIAHKFFFYYSIRSSIDVIQTVNLFQK